MTISVGNFENACLVLETTWQSLNDTRKWEDAKVLRSVRRIHHTISHYINPDNISQYDSKILRITKRIQDPNTEDVKINDDETEIIELDEEVVHQSQASVQELRIIYDIAHSPSYQVPVLYITFESCGTNNRARSILPSIEEVYALLSPSSSQAPMRAVGVMGALSMTDHPSCSAPAYFVHPCRTAEAMEAVAGGEAVGPERYLLLWMGLVGQGVGLDVPAELVEAMGSAL